MCDDSRNLDLTFPTVSVGGKETSLSLKRLLYKGGASTRVDLVGKAINDGSLGDIQKDRIELVRRLHECINGDLASGGSKQTAKDQISKVSLFFTWAENIGAALNIPEVEKTYLQWSEHLLQRFRVIKDMKHISAYAMASVVGRLIDSVLERAKPIVRATRLRSPSRRKKPLGTTDKQNLESTFAFGRLLQDICDSTPLGVIWGPPHVRIPLQQGGQIEFKSFNRDLLPEDERTTASIRGSLKTAQAYKENQSMNHRFRKEMVNMRIQAELLMFIGQTGMNLTQAAMIPFRRFSYSSDIDSYKVLEYKPRRGGEVLFEIFSEYRSHLERYLKWRKEIFPDSEKRIFPFIRRSGIREDITTKFSSIRAACKKSGVTWVTPRLLRGTRVNWLLRRSSDPDITAEMAQHHKRTLLTVYETPSQQRAVGEIMRFHLHNDPALVANDLLRAVGPGKCDGTPKAFNAKPTTAPTPDCQRPSGCLWCEHHRDIDSLDYVWSLACFRHLKILELSRNLPTKKEIEAFHPVEHVVQRLSEKLSWFRDSNVERREWVEEALMRVQEGHYHAQWFYLISAVEGESKC